MGFDGPAGKKGGKGAKVRADSSCQSTSNTHTHACMSRRTRLIVSTGICVRVYVCEESEHIFCVAYHVSGTILCTCIQTQCSLYLCLASCQCSSPYSLFSCSLCSLDLCASISVCIFQGVIGPPGNIGERGPKGPKVQARVAPNISYQEQCFFVKLIHHLHRLCVLKIFAS